jgi:hypothetical protein
MTEALNFINGLQTRTAMLAIGRSTLRNQGAAGMVDHARRHLSHINLREFSTQTPENFLKILDQQTIALKEGFPGNGRGNWGAARKSLNIFLRDVVYSRHLCNKFELAQIEPWLEVPLDSHVYAGLRAESNEHNSILRWPGVRNLTNEFSTALQDIAKTVAEGRGISRVHLDIFYWRPTPTNEIQPMTDEQ